MSLREKKLDYKWVILVCSVMMVFVCLGFCSSNKGLYLAAITEALEIPRSLFSINDSFRFITQSVVNLFFGALLARFGIRKMIGFGFLSLIASMVVYATANTIYVFYIGGVLLGLGLTFTTTTMASSLVRRWFKKDIGKYTGIVFASNGIGGALAAQIITPMIDDKNNAFGYRNAYWMVAVLLAVIGTLILIFIRERPKDDKVEVIPTKKKARGAIWSGISFKTAVSSPFFYLAGICVFLTGFSLQGINSAYAAHLKDVGLDPAFVANVSSVFALCLTVTKLIVGALYDRFGLRTVMLVCQSSAIIAFMALALLTPALVSSAGMVAAIVAYAFAVVYALALPLETLVVPLIANDLFGAKDFDRLLGLLIAMNYAGYALGSPLINLFYDKWGTYAPALYILSGLTVVLLGIFQLAINAANKVKRQVLSEEISA